jgi:small-conductance mechanosensitive channel
MIYAWITRDAMVNLPFLQHRVQSTGVSDARKTLVDLSPWQTAQALAPLAVSAEETSLAHEAERLADHEVDQAFAYALRRANLQHRAMVGANLALEQKVEQYEQIVKDDQAQVKRLTPNPAPGNAATGNPPASAASANPADDDDLDILKAQLALDSEVLDDAQDQLAQVTGDQRAAIQQELAAHEAAMAKYESKARSDNQPAVVSGRRYSTLAGRIGSWSRQSARRKLIEQALDEAQSGVAALTAEHTSLQSQASATEKTGAAATAPASASSSAQAPTHAQRLAELEQRSDERKLVLITSDRVQTQKELAAVYQRWLTQLALQRRILLHLILQSVALISFILIGVLLGNALIRRLMARPTLDQRRLITLQTILELSVQLLGAVLILLVVFGVPTQLQTILGLATAGLTVALQDFILAFLGWFVLMGKNGIRLGDSVEINGVSGQVAEVGLFRTTLLETGNSADQGHPTGRRVAFLNKFAVNGQYFNFSTTGQWMWDELPISVPASETAFQTIEGIHALVQQQTDADARQAEEEWKRVSRVHGLSQFSAAAQVNLRPAPGAIDVRVRYVTRAAECFETRNRIYQSILDYMQAAGKAEETGTCAATGAETPPGGTIAEG